MNKYDLNQHKILFLSNTANYSKFNRPYMQDLRARGWTVDYASPCAWSGKSAGSNL